MSSHSPLCKPSLLAALGIFFLILHPACHQESKILSFAVGGAPSEMAFWQNLAQEFQKKTGIPVELTLQPPDTEPRRQDLVTALQAKQPSPDIFLMDVAWVAQFTETDWLEPLNNFIKADRFDTSVLFKRTFPRTDALQDQLLALPVYVDGGLLYYRKDLLEQSGFSGPPKTWGELIAMSKKIQAKERAAHPDFYGFVWQGAQYEGLVCNFIEFAGSSGGGILVEDGRLLLSSPRNIRALELMTALIQKEKISPPNTFTEMKEEESRTQFQNGDALFERNWPYAWALHQKEDSPVRGKVGIAPLPQFEDGGTSSALGGWLIGISKFSDKKAAAWKFIEFLLSYDVQKNLALEIGWNPARRDVYKDPEVLKALPHFAKLEEVFEKTISRPTVPYYPQISDIMQRYLNAALAGKIEPDTALRAMQAEMQAVVSQYKKQ